jgi:hypothetical protein
MEENLQSSLGTCFSQSVFFFLGWLKKSIDFLAILVDVVLVCSSNFVPLFSLWEIRWAYHTINWGQAIFAWGMQTWNHSEKWCESSWSECPPETHQVAGPKCQIFRLHIAIWQNQPNRLNVCAGISLPLGNWVG